MSLKYQRNKKADENLPAPLRWLTRAFSSITLAVILLSIVALYGMFASVPLGFIGKGVIYGLIGVGTVGVAVLLAINILRGKLGAASLALGLRVGLAMICVAAGAVAMAMGCVKAYGHLAHADWFLKYRATVVYRLPAIEMTELQFYSWWPLKLILALFVLNLIWATVRRIEFRLPYLGVLTVHTGIITVALGSIFYGYAKVEGDTILWRNDLGGEPVGYFNDSITPAVYFAAGNKNLMLAIPELPRYNDYLNGSPRDLNIALHQREGFTEVLGPKLRATVRDFVAYGNLEPVWIDAAPTGAPPPPEGFENPAVRLTLGDENTPGTEFSRLLVSAIPAERVLELPVGGVEYLHNPTRERLADLTTTFDGKHGLVVEIPALNFRNVYGIKPGQVITLGDTGYSLTIEQIGDYGMSFATRGYENATDTRAVVQVFDGKRIFRRVVMHRYPERSQDFTPPKPGDPPTPGMGPMGKRSDPDAVIRLAYIDDSKPQFRLISVAGKDELYMLVRLPGLKPIYRMLPELKIPIGRDFFLHVTERFAHAVQTLEPDITPKSHRVPKDEGTYIHALLPVDLEIDIPATTTTPDGQTVQTTTTWKRRVWLTHMRYPSYPDDEHKPVDVNVPTLGRVSLLFSRKSLKLPFTLNLMDFKMTPYPGSDIPRDFIATLNIVDHSTGSPGEAATGEARLNNPLVYHGYKISQTGWDPGDRADPRHKATDDQGRYTNQQRFTILAIGNNVGIRVIFVGACLITLGIPLAFYGKPLLLQYEKRRIQARLTEEAGSTTVDQKIASDPNAAKQQPSTL